MGASYIDSDDGAQGEGTGFAEVKINGVFASGESLGGDGGGGRFWVVEVEGDLVGEVFGVGNGPLEEDVLFEGDALGLGEGTGDRKED